MTTHYETALQLLDPSPGKITGQVLPPHLAPADPVHRANDIAAAQVYATLALADELRLAREAVSTCPHGTTGLCMHCLTRTLEGALPR